MTNNKVASYAERIERLLEERDGINADIADIYQEVKSADLKPKVLRKAIANKRRKVDAQFEADVEEYAALLLALPGATYRSVAEQTGIPKSTLQRRVPRKENGTAHDPETGEITAATPVSASSRLEPEAGVGSGANSVEGGVANLVRDGGAPVATSAAGPAVTTLADEAERLGLTGVVAILEERRQAEDDLEPPTFLKRERVA